MYIIKNLLLILLISSFILVINFQKSSAETENILITYSNKMHKIDFDGRWSHFSEWKESSLNSIGNSVQIRTAHEENYIYVFVDVISDSTLDKGSDRTVICFDSENNKSVIPDNDDYCFIAVLERDVGFVLQGGSPFGSKGNFQIISNHDEFLAIGAVSNESDRYSKVPHPSYEFKIPTDLVGRTNEYGFYLETFDASSGKSLTWPNNVSKISPGKIPSPIFWGELISPDKSLPEFSLPLIMLVIMLISVIIMSKKLNNGRLRININ